MSLSSVGKGFVDNIPLFSMAIQKGRVSGRKLARVLISSHYRLTLDRFCMSMCILTVNKEIQIEPNRNGFKHQSTATALSPRLLKRCRMVGLPQSIVCIASKKMCLSSLYSFHSPLFFLPIVCFL